MKILPCNRLDNTSQVETLIDRLGGSRVGRKDAKVDLISWSDFW